jgi:hypothetical protein
MEYTFVSNQSVATCKERLEEEFEKPLWGLLHFQIIIIPEHPKRFAITIKIERGIRTIGIKGHLYEGNTPAAIFEAASFYSLGSKLYDLTFPVMMAIASLICYGFDRSVGFLIIGTIAGILIPLVYIGHEQSVHTEVSLIVEKVNHVMKQVNPPPKNHTKDNFQL